MSLSGHQSPAARSVDWLTPLNILAPLGCFDLDPCCPEKMPWVTAHRMLTRADDGLRAPWTGRVWLNPPFGKDAARWIARMAAHGNGIALLPARTETSMFFNSVWGVASAVLFIKGRPHFHRPDGSRAPFNSGAPICLIAYGEENAAALRNSDLGRTVTA